MLPSPTTIIPQGSMLGVRGESLRPVIASYSGESYNAVNTRLDQHALEIIARVAASPLPRVEIDPQTCADLIEMHVFKEMDGCIKLDTAVFLEADLLKVNCFASAFGKELAGRVAKTAAPLLSESPAVINFLVGIIGIVQSLGRALREAKTEVEWWNYGGKYARSKVDFDQICEAGTAAGPDFLNKTILRGSRYTAVFTGPGGSSYLLQPPPAGSAWPSPGYVWQVNRFLTDAFAMFLTGQCDHPALRSAAEQASLPEASLPGAAVLTNETVEKHLPTIEKVGRIVRGFYLDSLSSIQDLLAATTAGQQGVPAGNMTMHLWRYLRRAVARELYASGFFTDRLPETGLITIFFENNVEYLNEQFG